MGTTKTTDQSAKFDPSSMQQFQGMQPGIADTLKGYMQNPFGNPFFQTQQQMGTRQAQNLGQTSMSNILRNLQASGFGGGASSPFAMEMMQNQGRANSGLQAQLGFLNPVQNALGMQQWATGAAENYRPLQTGQNTTEKTGGLGTWLPQVLGGAAAIGLAPFTGGASLAGLGGAMGGRGGGGGMPTYGSSGMPFGSGSIDMGGGGGMAGTNMGNNWFGSTGGGGAPSLFGGGGGGGGFAPWMTGGLGGGPGGD